MRQEVMLEHSAMVSHYRESRSGLQARLESGINFKKSINKSVSELEFVPVNLHIQQMKAAVEGSTDKGSVEGRCVRGLSRAISLALHREGGVHGSDCGLPHGLQSQVQAGRTGQDEGVHPPGLSGVRPSRLRVWGEEGAVVVW